jgi:hypothetical protein
VSRVSRSRLPSTTCPAANVAFATANSVAAALGQPLSAATAAARGRQLQTTAHQRLIGLRCSQRCPNSYSSEYSRRPQPPRSPTDWNVGNVRHPPRPLKARRCASRCRRADRRRETRARRRRAASPCPTREPVALAEPGIRH